MTELIVALLFVSGLPLVVLTIIEIAKSRNASEQAQAEIRRCQMEREAWNEMIQNRDRDKAVYDQEREWIRKQFDGNN